MHKSGQDEKHANSDANAFRDDQEKNCSIVQGAVSHFLHDYKLLLFYQKLMGASKLFISW